MRTYDIVGIGEAIIDTVESKKKELKNPGGAPLNVIATCSKLGFSTAYITAIGNDDNGKIIEKCYNDFKIDKSLLTISNDIRTCVAKIKIDKKGERSFNFIKNNGSFLSLPNKLEDFNSKVLVCGTLCLFNENSRNLVLSYIKECKKRKMLIAFDANYRKTEMPLFIYMQIVREIIPFVDILKLSLDEAKIITSSDDINEIRHILMDNYKSDIIISLGKDGAIFINRDFSIYQKGKKVKPIDTTGAGDILFGTFLSSLIKNDLSYNNKILNPAVYKRALKQAVINSALSTKQYGAVSAINSIKKSLK